MEEDSQEKTQDSPVTLSPKLVVAVLFLALLGVGYILYRGGVRKNAPSPGTTQNTQNQAPTLAQEKVREISVAGSEFSFSPSKITLTKGERIRITFKNIGNSSHNLVVENLGVATKTIPGGATDSVEFVADKSGSFTFYCAVGNHRQLGMEGKLEVE